MNFATYGPYININGYKNRTYVSTNLQLTCLMLSTVSKFDSEFYLIRHLGEFCRT